MMWEKLEQDIERVTDEIAEAGASVPDMDVFSSTVQEMAAAVREVELDNSFALEEVQYYSVQCSTEAFSGFPPRRWEVNARYSEFRDLYNALKNAEVTSRHNSDSAGGCRVQPSGNPGADPYHYTTLLCTVSNCYPFIVLQGGLRPSFLARFN